MDSQAVLHTVARGMFLRFKHEQPIALLKTRGHFSWLLT